jgi:hypothetical protein
MPRKPAKTKPPRTWDGLIEGDITGAEEAEAEQLIEFGRRAEAKPGETGEPPEREPRCRKPKR